MGTVPNLTDETPLDQYTATASQTEFTFTFMIFATSDIKVYVNDVLKTETTDYVVKQADLSAIVPADDLPMDGGKIVFNSGLTVSDAVSISREIPIDRLTGYSVAGAFRANVLNTELTRMQAIMQQLERDIARSIRLSPSDAEGGTFELPEGRASKFLAFDASGNMIASAGSADNFVVSSFMETLLDDTTAAAALTTLGAQTQDDDLDDIAALTVARGDMLIGNSTPEWSNLAKGGANYLLKSDGTDLSWGFEVLDEDDLVSDSATKLATQQSIKAYVDIVIPGGATESSTGIIELATQAETNAGTDDSRAVTPLKLETYNKGWNKISTSTASASASISFTDLSSDFAAYKLIISGIAPATDNTTLYLRTSTDNGSTYDSGASDYAWNWRYAVIGSSAGDTGSAASNHISLGQNLGNAANEDGSIELTLFNPSATNYTRVNSHNVMTDINGSQVVRTGSGVRLSAADVDAIQLLYSSGNIATGTFTLYGFKA